MNSEAKQGIAVKIGFSINYWQSCPLYAPFVPILHDRNECNLLTRILFRNVNMLVKLENIC